MTLNPPLRLANLNLDIMGASEQLGIIYTTVYDAGRFHNPEGLMKLNILLEAAGSYMVAEGFLPPNKYLVNAHLIT